MSWSIPHEPTRTARAAAVSQQGQCEVVRDALGSAPVLAVLGGSGELSRVTMAAPTIDTEAEPREVLLGQVIPSTLVHTATGTPTSVEVRNGADVILRADAGVEGGDAESVEFFGSVKALCAPSVKAGGTIAVRADSGLPDTDVPLWLQGAEVNELIEIADTSLSDQPLMDAPRGSTIAAKVEGWCGHVADTVRGHLYSVGQGGHFDYYGREVERLDLTVDAPAWDQVVAPGSPSDTTSNADYYTDGSPAAQHGYHTCVFVPSLGVAGKLLRFPGGARSTSGNPSQEITAYDIDDEAYDPESAWGSLQCPINIAGANGAYAAHPTTGDVYCWFNNDRISRWNAGVPGTYTTLLSAPADPPPIYTAAAIDPTRGTDGEGIAFFLGGSGSGGDMCRAYDIGANSLSTITLTGEDIKAGTGMALMYVAALDQYIAVRVVSGAVRVYAITPTSGTSWACAEITTTGATWPSISSGSQFLPYTKPQYLPTLGVMVYHPTWTSNVFALKLHEV